MNDNDKNYAEICDIAVKQLTAAVSLSLHQNGFAQDEIINILKDTCKILQSHLDSPETLIKKCEQEIGLWV